MGRSLEELVYLVEVSGYSTSTSTPTNQIVRVAVPWKRAQQQQAIGLGLLLAGAWRGSPAAPAPRPDRLVLRPHALGPCDLTLATDIDLT